MLTREEIKEKINTIAKASLPQFEETVFKDIAFGPKSMGLSADEISLRVADAMRFVGLDFDKFAEKSPFDLSGGEKRRAALAGIIAMHPKYLVLDIANHIFA